MAQHFRQARRTSYYSGAIRTIKKITQKQAIGMKNKKIKMPVRQERIEDLRARLQKAIQLEEYEQAAVLRDRIRAIERKNGNK